MFRVHINARVCILSAHKMKRMHSFLAKLIFIISPSNPADGVGVRSESGQSHLVGIGNHTVSSSIWN